MKTWLSTYLATVIISSIGVSAVAQDSGDDAASSDTKAESAASVDSEVVIDIKGGDRIHGQLVGVSEDTYVVVSPILGTVSLPRDQVESVAVIAAKKKDADAEETKPSKEAADSKSEGLVRVDLFSNTIWTNHPSAPICFFFDFFIPLLILSKTLHLHRFHFPKSTKKKLQDFSQSSTDRHI